MFRAGAAGLLAGIDDLTDRLRSRVGTVAGTLDVCGPLGFGRRYLAPAVAEFRTLHPALQISLTLTDEVPAADPRQFDLIVHIGRLADSSMVACVVAPNRRFLCASPDYLARRPAPRLPQDLTAHDCIVLRENREDVTLWRFRKRGQEVSVRVPAVLASNDGDVVRQWAMLGHGVVMRSEWDVAEALAQGRLVRVLPDWLLPDAGVVALVARREGLSARVKLFLAFLQARFRPRPPWRE